MGGTPEAIDHKFVETWAERYRCGAANSRWRVGPKMASAMAMHPELGALAGITNYWDLETHIFETIGPDVQKKGSYTIPEFLTVGYWKTPRQLANYRKNEENKTDIPNVTRRAFSLEVTDAEKPGALSALIGVRIPVASALLTVWNPAKFTIIDVWALKTLSLLDESIAGIGFKQHLQPWWEDHYDLYLRACQHIAARVKPLGLRDVDRALWKWGQLNAPR